MTVNSRGTWDPEAAWGTGSDMTLVNQRASGTSGLRVTTSHWSLVAAGIGLAASARAEDLSGKLDRSVSHAVGTPFRPSEFLALIRPPAETDIDPIRGRVEYRTILDLRGPAEVLTRLENGTRIEVQTAPRPRRALEDRIRVLGWIVAGCALLLVGGVLVRRHALAHRTPAT